jgi:hypothetical protein
MPHALRPEQLWLWPAVVFDTLGVADEHMAEHAEAILELLDWRVCWWITPGHPRRLKGLLLDSLSPAAGEETQP